MYPDEFHVVSRRKSVKIGKKVLILRNNSDISWKGTDFDRNGVLRRVRAAVEELRESSYKKVIFDGLKQSLSLLNFDGFSEFICYGLGQFRENSSSKYQLALLVTLQEHYKCKIHIYDPKFSEDELEILKTLGLEVIVENERGKRRVNDKVTLVYLPHCPKQLTNNFLYANWGLELNNCVLLSNSWWELYHSQSQKELLASAAYVLRIHPYVTEIPLRNTFKYVEAFSSTNIHIFTKEKLTTVPANFWDDREEPKYSKELVLDSTEEKLRNLAVT
ncbi:SRR1-like protein isoform X1 [Orussus abietinus]|uniref:SRR1-like protein isoform X1 n=1 Tax=Orussus abietinus TaxID=222816 RepID=UPI000625627B|nr:SRR1-like protein isoform X1 [Orussus abietinus]XP_012285852.1 SRR1-like protein isoform X1 [Orussus abietinus]